MVSGHTFFKLGNVVALIPRTSISKRSYVHHVTYPLSESE